MGYRKKEAGWINEVKGYYFKKMNRNDKVIDKLNVKKPIFHLNNH